MTVIDFTDIDSLGYYHNQILLGAANADHSSIDALRNYFTTTYFLEYSNPEYSIDELFNLAAAIHDTLKNYGYDIRNWSNSPFNDNVSVHLNKIFAAIDSMESNNLNYVVFESAMNQITLDVSSDSNLSEEEKNNLTQFVF